MDRDDLIDLFSEFGPVTLRRMFGGYGIAVDGVNFAMSLSEGIIVRVDEVTIPRFEAEGAKPFQYDTRNKTVVVKSYRHLPERLYDDPEELAVWAREAVGAAKRAAVKKSARKRKAGVKTAPAKAGAKVKSKSGKASPVQRKTVASKATSGKTKVRKRAQPKRQAT